MDINTQQTEVNYYINTNDFASYAKGISIASKGVKAWDVHPIQ